MRNEIFIKPSKHLTLEQYLPIASDTMSLIAEAAEGVEEIDETFSITDLSVLLNEISEYMSGEFEVRRMFSDHCEIVYVPSSFNEAAFEEKYVLNTLIETHSVPEIRLWISEKILITFMDRKLHGVATAFYFYLGYLMTRDSAFAVSHNISFEKILEGCDTASKMSCMKHRTSLMRVLADLEDVGFIKWNINGGTFEVLYITPYDPAAKV